MNDAVNAQMNVANYQSAFGNLGMMQQAVQYYPQPVVTAAPAKKVKKAILDKLRDEIDGWHGDVLCRSGA